MANLAQLLTDTAARYGDRPALQVDEAVVTYEQFDDAAGRVAGWLRSRGLRPGDRVGVMLPNVPYFAVVYYGVLRAGGVVVPMNVLLKEREVAFYLGNPEAELVFAWHEFADDAQAGAEQVDAGVVVVEPGAFRRSLAEVDPLSEVVPRDDDDTAVILYTSGTTGTPKGAELTHANLRRNVEVVRDVYGLHEQWVTLGALPFFHPFGQTCSLNVTISVGACLTLIPRFDPGKALDIIERDRVTLFQGVPTMYSAMLNHPAGDRADTSSLINCVSGGASLPVEVLRAFEEKFNCKILEGYGLSETSPVASSNMPDRERKAGSIGLPIPGVEMRVVDRDDTDVAPGDVGEIV